MDEGLKTFLFTISGIIVGTIGTVIITYITKKSEEKRQFHEIILKFAIESWKASADIVKENKLGSFYPLEIFIIQAKMFFYQFHNVNINKLTIENLKIKLDEVKKVKDATNKWVRENNQYENILSNT